MFVHRSSVKSVSRSYYSNILFQGPREVIIWMAVRHSDRKALGFLAREIAPAGTGMGMRVEILKMSDDQQLN